MSHYLNKKKHPKYEYNTEDNTWQVKITPSDSTCLMDKLSDSLRPSQFIACVLDKVLLSASENPEPGAGWVHGVDRMQWKNNVIQ